MNRAELDRLVASTDVPFWIAHAVKALDLDLMGGWRYQLTNSGNRLELTNFPARIEVMRRGRLGAVRFGVARMSELGPDVYRWEEVSEAEVTSEANIYGPAMMRCVLDAARQKWPDVDWPKMKKEVK